MISLLGASVGGATDGAFGVGGHSTTATGGAASGGRAKTGGVTVEGSDCMGNGGPSMVRLPQGYCIDTTEVTRAHYSAWLATTPSTALQIAECSWNTSFAPNPSCMTTASVCQSNCSDHPQVCVDWCDAYSYCQAMGKRLCGKLGGGSNAFADYASASLSQWYSACTLKSQL